MQANASRAVLFGGLLVVIVARQPAVGLASSRISRRML